MFGTAKEVLFKLIREQARWASRLVGDFYKPGPFKWRTAKRKAR